MNFTLPRSIKDELDKLEIGNVIVGVRPEHIKDQTAVKNNQLSEPQQIRVDVIEPVGNEVFVYFKFNDSSYCMRMPPGKLYSPGENIKIGFDLNKLYLFDT
ncbi:MAG: TOBE domain-containing protein, partial [Aliifodinibius sp.]|nr:TOBE domain-containing protein [Fodinibius sp.]